MNFILCLMLPLSAENLITNGGFENSAHKEKWHVEYPDRFYGQYFPHSRITTDKAHVRSGEKAVHLLSDLFFSAKHIKTKPGDRYRISVWAKGTGRMEFLVFEYGKYAHIIQENILGNVSLDDQYRQYSFDYESGGHVTEKRVRKVGLFLPCLRFRNVEESGYIDDWSMVRLESVEKKFDLRVHWPEERILALSESERDKATLVSRSDYDTSSFWKLPLIKKRPFWFTLKSNWYEVKWLRDEPLVRYSMPMAGFDQRKFATLRELELYGPDGNDNLARIEGSKPFGERWKQLELLNDGKAPTDTAYKWTKVHDAAYNGYQWEPLKAAAGIEFAKPLTVSRAV
ncbi:MAG: hypothetical protein QF886_18615, partial [Planctomycetota bacterium]|nr:hypothetical protein [Planctomycetota bacterium]